MPPTTEVETEAKMSMVSDVAERPKRVSRAVTVPRKHKARTKVTNGAVILHGIADGRTHAARRYTDLVALVCADQGGPDRMSQAKLQLARRFAALAVQLEALESRLANGEQINVPEYTALTSSLVRVVSRLGLGREMKDVMTLGEVLRRGIEEEQQEAADG